MSSATPHQVSHLLHLITAPASSVDEQGRLHIWPRARGEVARELGVEVQADCGAWVWPGCHWTPVRTKGDLARVAARPGRCQACVRVVEAEAGIPKA
jgi:hypothetical protein